ncbi:MAG: PCI domain-containing protein, partial [Promethearchaeota archaeon]
GCFIDLLDSGNIFSFNEIANRFNLHPEFVPDILKLYQQKGKLKNVIDPIKKVYISLRKDYEDYLIGKILKEEVNLQSLAKEMQELEERQIRLILLTITKNRLIMGKFIDSHTFITEDLIYQDIAQMIKDQGSVQVLDISTKFLADINEAKRLISQTIKKGLVKAFYSPDSSTIIFGEGIQTKLLEILQEKGKIYIDRTAKALGIHPNLLRDQIKQFIENGQVDGWYTQDRGFATLEHLKSEMLGILKLYEKISIKELISRMFLPVKYVEILLQTLINEEKVAGALSDGIFKRTEMMPLVQAKAKLPAWAIKKIEAAANLQHILIIHKLSGTCLFSYPCSALNFDPDLVSGFLQAISSFGTEVSSHETGLEAIKYQGFVVALSEGELIRSAFICNESPDRTLLSSIKYFTIKFEDEFRPELEKWTGDITSFRKTPQLVEEYFKVGSKLLFLIPKMPTDQTLTKEKVIEKLRTNLKENGRINLDRLEMELGIHAAQINRFLTDFALEGLGRFTIDQKEFVTEDKLNEEVAEIILTSTEIPIARIAQETKIGESEVEDFLRNLLTQGTIRGRIENRVFHRE